MDYILLIMLTLKHFLADFVYQPPFQWKNKGTYGHIGGVLHSGQHILLTGFILGFYPVSWLTILGICSFEFLIHYHMDWFKMRYNAYKGWSANTHNEFWVLMGFDQLIHSLTYILIIYLVKGI